MSAAPPAFAPPLDPDAVVGVAVHPAVGEDWPEDGLGPVATLAAALPAPDEGAAGTWIAVDGGHAARRGVLGRLLGRGAPRVHLAVRCTALLVRGYEDVCADAQGVAYGRVPRRTGNPPTG